MLNIFFKNIFTDVHGVYYKRTYKENRINYKLMIYKYIAGMERELPFSLESTGTQSLLELLPFMLVVLKGWDNKCKVRTISMNLDDTSIYLNRDIGSTFWQMHNVFRNLNYLMA